MRLFWVNQGQTFEQERRAGALWAPKLSRPRRGQVGGTARAHWDRMLDAEPGDLVVHYARKAVRGWSTVVARATDAPPPFDLDDRPWSEDGRLLRVELQTVEPPIQLSEIPLDLRLEQDRTSWPFSRRGDVKQVYLSEIDGGLADWLLGELGVRNDVAQVPSWPGAPAGTGDLEYTADRQVLVTARSEQSRLRRRLFGDELVGTCALCGRDLPVAMLVAAHIKRRADTTDVERRRLDIVMPACSLGCDVLFELGYVIVAKDGIIARGPRRMPNSEDLELAMRGLIGRTCAAWSAETERYFAYHRKWQAAAARRYGLA